MEVKDYGGVLLAQSNLLGKYPLIHGITTRHGGVSKAPYHTLNLGLHVHDEKDYVVYNRQKLCEVLGLNFHKLTTCAQVHGTKVVEVTKENAGAGRADFATTIADCDGLITKEKGIPLLLFFADCTPILIYDKVHHAIGIAHAGWRGTVGAIAVKTLQAMGKAYGTKPGACVALIGNAIGPCCYEVGGELIDQVKANRPDDYQDFLIYHQEKNKYHFDLWSYNHRLLLEAGIPAEDIDRADICTNCHADDYFSYRHDKGKTGRIGAILCLK